MYNKKLIRTLEERFDVLRATLVGDQIQHQDLYSTIASIMYNKAYEDCLEWKDGKLYPEGKKRRASVKQMLIPVVLECGGISNDTEEIKKIANAHRRQAAHFRDCVHDSNEDIDSENNSELLDQAVDCDQIANWLEELLALREMQDDQNV